MKKNEYSGSLPRNTLDLISPFHFTFDRDLKIISAGKGIEKIAPNIVGSDFSKLFQFKRPFSTLYEFDSIIKYTKQIFLLDSVDSAVLKIKSELTNDITKPAESDIYRERFIRGHCYNDDTNYHFFVERLIEIEASLSV